jgi:hypothetical protein
MRMDSRKGLLEMYAAMALGFILQTFIWAMIALGTYSFIGLVWGWIT